MAEMDTSSGGGGIKKAPASKKEKNYQHALTLRRWWTWDFC